MNFFKSFVTYGFDFWPPDEFRSLPTTTPLLSVTPNQDTLADEEGTSNEGWRVLEG